MLGPTSHRALGSTLTEVVGRRGRPQSVERGRRHQLTSDPEQVDLARGPEVYHSQIP